MTYDPSGRGATRSAAENQIKAGQLSTSGAPDDRLLDISGLTVDFRTRRGISRAVNDVALSVRRGEILGLVGESGSGKSITALSVLGLVPAPGRIVAGQIVFDRRNLLQLPEAEIAKLRGRRIGYISQSPRAALNPSFRIREQMDVTLRACAPELDAAGRADKARSLLEQLGFADPERVAAAFPHQLSGGMCQRICIAMALAGSPDLLIADEPTTALDVAVQAQILALLHELNRKLGLAILIVSHDLALIRAIAHRIVVLYGGEVQETGDVGTVLAAPRHPYTGALLQSVPDPDHPSARLAFIPGFPEPVPPDADGCRFAPRCGFAFAPCLSQRPILRLVEDGVRARCHLLDPGMATP
ncbi:ABC transporter ATP-binding protein [Kaistia terrae]|uniref:ABC transporter ATP-binding protein n=1 Tax=Kaistia terrae TaxID=537017 RepID=A0ABW0PTB8_9HYPH|nr:ABC transporter ATP-binding protein [Kaistia terrae]MCX5578558.1 ABC transporter ATP-binding protein [Kaistia terrae]